MNMRLMSAVLTGMALTICTVRAQEPVPQPVAPGLIPIKASAVLKSLQPLSQLGVQLPPLSAIKSHGSEKHFEYDYHTDELSFTVDAFTGDILDLSAGKRESHTPSPDDRLMSNEDSRKKAVAVKDLLYPAPGILKLMSEEDGSFGRIFRFQNILKNGVYTPNKCMVVLNRLTGEVIWYNARYRAAIIASQPKYSEEEAVAIAAWTIQSRFKMTGAPIRVSKLNDEQMNFPGNPYQPYKDNDAQLMIEEDAWLNQRLSWSIAFDVGFALVDAVSGQFVDFDVLPVAPVPVPVAPAPAPMVKPPENLPGAQTAVTEAGIKLNEYEINGPEKLHYPPIVRNDAVLIFADYFPNFMISTAVHGDDIGLQGQLKDKGKRATLKVGDKKAAVDGHEVELSAAPVVIDGRLYLPAELLQQVNGIPTHWEPLKKLLSVETRYLRRD